MWLAPAIDPTLNGRGLRKFAAAVGFHVGSFVRHLSQPEVADVVAGEVAD